MSVTVEESTRPNMRDVFHLQQDRHEIVKAHSPKPFLTLYP